MDSGGAEVMDVVVSVVKDGGQVVVSGHAGREVGDVGPSVVADEVSAASRRLVAGVALSV